MRFFLLDSLLLSGGGGENQTGGGGGSIVMTLVMMGLMVGMVYFMFIRPESKRKKAAVERMNSLQIADEVVTAGGIIGRVLDVKPDGDTVVIETGGDKTRIRILKSYIIENRTVHDD